MTSNVSIQANYNLYKQHIVALWRLGEYFSPWQENIHASTIITKNKPTCHWKYKGMLEQATFADGTFYLYTQATFADGTFYLYTISKNLDDV